MKLRIKKWIISILAALLFFRIAMLVSGLHFYSVYAEQFFWFILSVLVLSIWFINLKTTGRVVLTVSSIIVYSGLYIVVMFFTWLIIGAIDDVRPEKFKNIEQKVWIQFHQGSWGGRPYMTVGIGKSYLGGLLYSVEDQFEFNPETPNMASDKYDIPKTVSDPEWCPFWEEKGWLFDFNNNVCYKLKKRKPVELSPEEISWKAALEKKLNVSVFLGKGTSDIKAIYEKPSTIYLTLNFNDTAYIQALSNEEVEQLSSEIVRSLTTVLNHPEKYDQVYLHFITNDHRDKLYLDCSLDYTLEYKYARYDLKKKSIIPNKSDVDYVKSLYIPWTKFLRIDYDGRNNSQKVFSNSLGCELHHIREIGPVKHAGKTTYKGLKCDIYEGRNPDKIRLKNGYLINRFRYIVYKETLVDVTIYYECYPSNFKFTYKEIVDKITYDVKSDSPEKMYYRYVDENYLKFRYETKETIISCKADTLTFPWTIEYNTCITQPIFLYPYIEMNNGY